MVVDNPPDRRRETQAVDRGDVGYIGAFILVKVDAHGFSVRSLDSTLANHSCHHVFVSF